MLIWSKKRSISSS